jgi:lipopolysaccharide biosynthesis glycosyltransferase
MNIIFTICSNNYLAQAFTLQESLLTHNPDVEFYIGLVDELMPGMSREKQGIIPVKDVVEEQVFNDMTGIYNITELNTAVKPFYLEYFFKEFDANKVMYLDPDIMVFTRFENLWSLLETNSAVVTPHFCTPQIDTKEPSNFSILSTGVYNLGFIAFSRTLESMNFILWWKQMLYNQCYDRNGYFTDQLWVNYITCFCDNVHVLRDMGYNVANWNLHERSLTMRGNVYYVNDKSVLVFFHFSNYSVKFPDRMAWYNNRFKLSERPDVQPVFKHYVERLFDNGYANYSAIKPQYGLISKKISTNRFKLFVIRILNKIIRLLS